jgi:hypothetical protein
MAVNTTRTSRLLTVAVVISVMAACLSLMQPAPASAKTYANMRDINCPLWSVDEPVAIYAVVAANANALCVKAYSGTVWGGGRFTESRGTLYAHLLLWAYYGGSYHALVGQYAYLNQCFWYTGDPLPYSVWILHVDKVYLCTVDRAPMHVQTSVFPPHGCYHAELTIRTQNETLIDVNSDGRCY